MIGYWLFRKEDYRAFCFTFDYEQAKSIAVKNNCFIEEAWVE